jgi:putative hydrolase of the HAD superfamily
MEMPVCAADRPIYDLSDVSLKVVTFDFWETLVQAPLSSERLPEHLNRLRGALSVLGFQSEPLHVESAYARATARIAKNARLSLQEIGPTGRWSILAEELGVSDGAIPFDAIEQFYEQSVLEPLLPLMPFAREAISELKNLGYGVGIISNTSLPGGKVLRELLARHGLLGMFDVTVWSDEVGWIKPCPRMFQTAFRAFGDITARQVLHVGDLEEVDVLGGRWAGCRTALYVASPTLVPPTSADLIVRSWEAFPRQVVALDRPSTSPIGKEN